jgi:hypothetical protein
MLEKNPGLDALTVKDILHKSSRADSCTGAVPNTTWGYGKIDALAALDLMFTTPQPSFQVNSVVNGASFVQGPISPGEIVTFFGSGLGPSNIYPRQF